MRLGIIGLGRMGGNMARRLRRGGIEYGMMQAYAESFALLKARDDFGLELSEIAETWRHGSVVRSWLLDLTASLQQDYTAKLLAMMRKGFGGHALKQSDR